jgi:hypothetical protein
MHESRGCWSFLRRRNVLELAVIREFARADGRDRFSLWIERIVPGEIDVVVEIL